MTEGSNIYFAFGQTSTYIRWSIGRNDFDVLYTSVMCVATARVHVTVSVA